MPRRPFTRAAALLCFLLAPALPAQPAATGTIEGRVLHAANGEYLENARLTLEGTALETASNADGSYRLTGVPAGPVQLRAFFTGLAARTVTLTVAVGQVFRTKQTEFQSLNSPAKRDLVGELAAACAKKGLGLCLYYSHGRDWRHPHAPNNDQWGGQARPQYNPPEPTYATGAAHHLQKYLDFMTAQITELLTQYGPIAAIWLDGIAVPRSRPERLADWRLPELYAHIHRLQPQVLVSYKQGLIGKEDFLAPERTFSEKTDRPLELCDTLQPQGWGYLKADDGHHKTPDQVMTMLGKAAGKNANLLLNTGPLPDGSVHPEDVATLTEVGRRLRTQGWPTPIAPTPEAPKQKKKKSGNAAP